MLVESVRGPLELVGDPQRIDFIPIIGQLLDSLEIDRIVDSVVPENDLREVPVSQSVRALVAAALLGNHTLYNVSETLEQYDTSSLFSGQFKVSDFYDCRLGRALESLHKAGLSNLRSGLVLKILKKLGLSSRFLHGDATNIQFFGAYSESEECDPENPDSAPHVTRGYSKRQPAEFKQILASLVTTQDGIPLYFRATDGNRSENLEYQFYIRLIADQLPNLKDPILVGDAKLCTGPNFHVATSHGIRLLTLLPENYKVWNEAYELARGVADAWPLLRARVRRSENNEPEKEDDDSDAIGRVERRSDLIQPTDLVDGTWHGVSVNVTHMFDDGQTLPARALVIESSMLKAQKESAAKRAVQKEADVLERLSKSLSKKTRIYDCLADAESALNATKISRTFHEVQVEVESFTETPKRSGRGRPKKEEAAATVTRYRLKLSYTLSQAKTIEWIRRESTFILITQSGLMGEEAPLTDADMLDGYKGQQKTVERRFQIMKGPLNVAPIFLKSTERINALIFIYQIATTIHALMESVLRNRLRDENAEMPDNKGYTSKPTIESARKLAGGLSSQEAIDQKGNRVRLIHRMTIEQSELYRRLGLDIQNDDRYVIETVSELRRGDRGFRPRSKDHGSEEAESEERGARTSRRKIFVRPD